MTKKNDPSPTSATPTPGTPTAEATTPTADGTTATADGTPEDPGDTAQQCKPPVDATVPLPPKLGVVQGKAVRPSYEFPMFFQTPQQILEDLIADMRKSFLVPGSGWMLPEVRARFDALCILHADMADWILLEAHPQNSILIPAAGLSVLTAARTVPGGSNMEVDTDTLEKKLNWLNFLLEIRKGQQDFNETLDKNIAKVENEVDAIVRQALKPVGSMLDYNVRLKRALKDARELVRRNTTIGVQTRKDHENVSNKAVEKYQKEQQKSGVPVPPPPAPGTVVSVTAGAPGAAVPPVAQPGQPARLPKPRKRSGPHKTK